MRAYSVPGTISDAEIRVVRERDAVLVFIELTFWWEKTTNE